jgi:hypothetical protein
MPQPVEQLAMLRACGEESVLKAEQALEGGVVIDKFLSRPEHGDGGRNLVEGRAIGLDMAVEVGFHALIVGDVDGEAGDPGVAGRMDGRFGHLEGAPRAVDVDDNPAFDGAALGARALGDFFRGRVEFNLVLEH